LERLAALTLPPRAAGPPKFSAFARYVQRLARKDEPAIIGAEVHTTSTPLVPLLHATRPSRAMTLLLSKRDERIEKCIRCS
jgi:hypothetical protein